MMEITAISNLVTIATITGAAGTQGQQKEPDADAKTTTGRKTCNPAGGFVQVSLCDRDVRTANVEYVASDARISREERRDDKREAKTRRGGRRRRRRRRRERGPGPDEMQQPDRRHKRRRQEKNADVPGDSNNQIIKQNKQNIEKK